MTPQLDGVRALTVRQPWAWAIVHAGKDVENRSRRTHYRGPLLIHAGSALDRSAFEEIAAMGIDTPEAGDVERGAVIGVVTLINCVSNSQSAWAIEGAWHWLLADPRPVDPVPSGGRLGLWSPAQDVITAVSRTATHY